MQRNLKTFLGLFVLTLAATAILINHLYARVDSAAMKQAQLTEHSRSMGEELSTLKALKSELENDLSEREERVQLVSERLGELEKCLAWTITPPMKIWILDWIQQRSLRMYER